MSYFVSKSREAISIGYYDPQYFFDSCLVTMKKYETQVKEKYYDKKTELETNIRNRKENNNLEYLSKIENEIRQLSISDSSIEINDIIHHYSGPLTGNDIVRIKKNIYSAFYEVCPNECMEMAIRESKECLPDEVLKEMVNTSKKNIDNLDNKIKPESETELTESEKYKKSITISKIATAEDVELYPGLEIGKTFKLPLPLPKDRDELFEQFKKLYAQRYFEAEQVWFYNKYGRNACREIVEDALKQIETFIQEAESLSKVGAFENNKRDNYNEFLRLKYGYYKNENRPFIRDVYYYFNSNAIYVYATNFLYKDWLESKRNKFHISDSEYDYKRLCDDLKQWFTTTPINLKSIIEKKKTVNELQVIWKGRPTDGWWFIILIWGEDVTASYFNNCFSLKSGKKLYKSAKPKPASTNKLKTILEKLLK